MIPTTALLPLLALPALAAPLRMPMPMNHRRDIAHDERGLLSGLGLDVGLDLDLGLNLDLAPVLDLDLGIELDLESDTWLKCHNIQGPFGGRQYDLGCTCVGSAGGLLLEVDVEAVVNVAGLDAWVRAQVGRVTSGRESVLMNRSILVLNLTTLLVHDQSVTEEEVGIVPLV